jgi:hypothetical protein
MLPAAVAVLINSSKNKEGKVLPIEFGPFVQGTGTNVPAD